MLGKMLKADDYDQMIHQKDVRSVVMYLKNNTYYGQALEEIKEHDVHRGHVEVLLYRAELTDALKIAKFLKGNEKTIYRYVYRKQEIEDLKKMLRTLQQGASLSTLDRRRLFVSRYSRIDFNKALEAKSISELINTIKDTNFYQILKPLLKGDNNIDLFAAEMALDTYYFLKIKDQLKTLASGRDSEILRDYFGSEADIKNLMWIYRGKHYYKLPKEMLYRYLIPFGNRLKRSLADQMIEAKDEEQLLKLMKEGPYGIVFDSDMIDWERRFMQKFLKMQLSNLRMYPYSLAPIVGYVYAKETEIYNITTIIEGVRYNVEPERIRKMLITKNALIAGKEQSYGS